MTTEKAIEILSDVGDINRCCAEDAEALDMAIKALKAQPCEDCISRQAVEEMIKAEMPERGMWEIEGDKEKETVCEVCVDLMQKLSELPSVQPTSPTARWERLVDDFKKCSKCGRPVKLYRNYKYCPECRAKMEEVEE